MSDAAQTERHGFGAEVGRLLDLVVHSLYSEREIFLRELVANAADAIDRRRFEALTDPSLALPDEGRVRIAPDKAARTITISDSGIGMSKHELIENLGTIARSGTLAFGQTLASAKPEDRPNLIGQFGVGFYSAFMIADRVEVVSRRAGLECAWRWVSDGAGEFTVSPAQRDEAGTDIVLHVKADADEFLEPTRIETIVRKWADHVTVPIVVVRDGRDERANEGSALWRKNRTEVLEESYKEFYRHLGHFFDEPWATLHWKAEGTVEYFALLFVPGSRPFDFMEQSRESRVRLHVRRMFITDEANLLPPWLRFVQGVIDTEDLPLNVSREMLQTTPVLARIRRALTNRVLTELKARAKDEADYAKFWDNFGPVVKEGIWDDAEHRTDIVPLLRFRSSAKEGAQEGWTSLAEYVARMQPGQAAIYYLAGDSIEALRGSPQLEGLRSKSFEVLLLADPIDAFWPDRLDAFEGHPIRSVTQDPPDLTAGAAPAEPETDVAGLSAALKEVLGSDVADVRASHRLVESAVILAAAQSGPDLQMQRLLRRTGRTMPAPAPVLEINPRHALIRDLARHTDDKERIAEAARTLLDLARVQEGDLPPDPGAFARRVTGLLSRGLG
jgi:molecular chaperone HtpG